MFDLAREALEASGLVEEERVCEYLGKLDFLSQKFGLGKGESDLSKLSRAKTLFEALWKERPSRYQKKGNFRLNEVIDAQLTKERGTVGNCLGLTLLYNCLLEKIGIEALALHLENAFGIRPHVLTLLRIDNVTIDIENIFSDGFDFKGHKQYPTRLVWSKKDLVADIYQSRGTEFFRKGKLDEGLNNYNTALKLNPRYEKAELNRAILLDRMKLDQ